MRKNRIIILALILFAFVSRMPSQNGLTVKNKVSDSLKMVLKTAANDSVRCNILNAMIEAENDNTIWPAYNDELQALCKKNINDSTPLTSIFYKHLSDVLNNNGVLALEHGKVDEALKYYSDNLELQKKLNDKNRLPLALYSVGLIYQNQGNVALALDFYYKSLKMQEENNDKMGMAYTLNIIGIMYKDQKNYTKALECYFKSLKLREEVKHKKGIAQSVNNIGTLYLGKGDLKTAEYYLQRSLKLQQELNDPLGIASSLNNLGYIAEGRNDIKGALELYQRAVDIQEKMQGKESKARTFCNMGRAYSKIGKINETILYAEKGLKLSQELGYPNQIDDASSILSEAYFKKGDYKKAYEMQVLFKKMSDSINSQAGRKAMVQKDLQYAYSKKAAQDSIRSMEEKKVSALQLNHEKNQRYVLYAGVIILILFGAFMFKRFKVTQKQKQIIEAQKKIVEEKQKEVMDSIRYAKRIQQSLLPTEKYLSRFFGGIGNNSKKT